MAGLIMINLGCVILAITFIYSHNANYKRTGKNKYRYFRLAWVIAGLVNVAALVTNILR